MYCIIIWGSACESTLWPIFRFQKRSIRLITNTKKRDSTISAFHRLRILRLPELFKYGVLLFMFKFKNNLLPPIFNEFYSVNSAFHRYPTRKANHLRGPKLKTKMAQLFIKNSGAQIWNSYDAKIDHEKSISCFKKDIMEIFLSTYSVQENRA